MSDRHPETAQHVRRDAQCLFGHFDVFSDRRIFRIGKFLLIDSSLL